MPRLYTPMSRNVIESRVDGTGLTHELVEWDGIWLIYNWPVAASRETVRIPERVFESEETARQSWNEIV